MSTCSELIRVAGISGKPKKASPDHLVNDRGLNRLAGFPSSPVFSKRKHSQYSGSNSEYGEDGAKAVRVRKEGAHERRERDDQPNSPLALIQTHSGSSALCEVDGSEEGCRDSYGV